MRFLQKPLPEDLNEAEIPDWNRDVWATACKLVSKMSVRELLDWTDLAGNGMAKSLQDYQRWKTPDSLLDTRRALIQMYALTQELILRDVAERAVEHRPGRE